MSDPRKDTDRISTPDSREGADAARERLPASAESPTQVRQQWSRRRFGKTALGVTPVIATLYGRPLWASANCTPSGWVSGNTSNHVELQDCGGRRPQDWQVEGEGVERTSSADLEAQSQAGGTVEDNAAPGKRHGILNKELSSRHGFPGLNYLVDGKPATIRDALSSVPFDRCGPRERELIRYGTAALLNARFEHGYSLFRREDLVTEMVAGSVRHGGYTTPSGDYLDASQVLQFLKNTMDSPSWGV